MGEIGEHWRDVKAHRKQEQLKYQHKAASQPKPCYDWMIVSGCHYARDRTSFKTYRPIRGTAQGMRVEGIGTVELEIVRAPNNPQTHTLVLENVLHIVGAIYNGFSSALVGGSQSWPSYGTQGLDERGEPVYYGTKFCGLTRLVLAGHPRGGSPFAENYREGHSYMLSIHLSDEEARHIFA